MAARLKVKGYQGLKHCLAFLLLSAPLKSSFQFLGLGSHAGAGIKGCSQCQSSGSQFPPPIIHSLIHWTKMAVPETQQWTSLGYRPHLWAADLLLLIFLPKEEDFRAWSGDGERPREGDRESQGVRYLEGGDSFLSPSLRPLPRSPPPPAPPPLIQSTMALEWATIIGSFYLSHRTEVLEGSAGLLCWVD